ncbi:hypothetical protein [Actinomycetospora callitridis]|uniref:hypothetical protein n=1 Tax=Actinomycetospora callitridis TaxID=913944 RepID=UPI00236537D4|nr:hypothetical protein [Actinomycetospora callitridis]MDD7917167.1 hypothetical protein [Actinomycetospora callitridis]
MAEPARSAHPLARPGVARPLARPPAPWPSDELAGELPDGPGSRFEAVHAFVAEHRARLLRLGLHLLVAALPLLAISAHVFGIAPMNVTAGLLVVPLTLVTLLLGVFSPSGEERLLLSGAMWGVLATLVYDAVRLDTVYLLGWWGDFIPRVGTWILGSGSAAGPGSPVVGAVVGYLWRYVGDGGGIGVAFFVLVAATGLRRWGARATVAASVTFAVFPVWTGLVATVALAPRGQQQMFPLTPATVLLSLVGHLVFGLVLGLGCARCRRLEEYWPWTPLLDLRRGVPALVPVRPARNDGWGPPALVTTGGDDPERTEIRPLAPPRPADARRGGARPHPLDPASGPVRVLDMPPGPAPAVRAGPRPRSGPWSGPVPIVRQARPGTGPWPHPAPPGGDPWSGPVRSRATSSAKAPPGRAGRG